MTVLTRKQTRASRRPTRRAARKPTPTWRAPQATVRLVRPKGTPAALERAHRLANAVRQELAALNDESLDQVMFHLRGRAWSS
jgi:aspartate aminotransferase-like enzyme